MAWCHMAYMYITINIALDPNHILLWCNVAEALSLKVGSTTQVDGPSWRVSKNAPEFTGRQLGPSTRVVETDLK